MTKNQIKIAANGVAALAEATDSSVTEILESLTASILSEQDASEILQYMSQF